MGTVLIALAAAAMPAAPALRDAELARLRGGFAIPGGLDVAIAVDTQTRIDGGLVLRSVYRLDNGPPSTVVYAPEGPGAREPVIPSASAERSDAGKGWTVTFDRIGGARIEGGGLISPGLSVNVGTAPQGPPRDDGPPVPLPKDGAAASVPGGQLSVTPLDNGQRIRLQGEGYEINHLTGNALGSLIANTADSRVIDTATNVSMEISGATLANLGSTLLRVDALGIDAAAGMMPK